MSGEEGEFVWPPVRSDEDRSAGVGAREGPACTGTHGVVIGRRRGVLEEVESVWLGLDAQPFVKRSVDAGWSPDLPGSYCWRCGVGVGPYEELSSGCSRCRTRNPVRGFAWDRVIRVGKYEGVLKEAIREMKFHAWRRLARDMGAVLGRSVREGLEADGRDPSRVLAVPVPTTRVRVLQRGIDHAGILSREAARVCGGRSVRVLGRRHRRSQVRVPASERSRNMAGSMRVRRGPVRQLRRIVPETIVLVDDVMTTGATMRTAALCARKWFNENGLQCPPIWCGVLARAERVEDHAEAEW